MLFPSVTTEVAFTTAPGSTSPVWVDISDHVKSCSPTRGRDSELSQAQPGTNSLVLDNRDRDFDSSYASGPYFGNIKPGKRIRQYSPLTLGLEFWGDFEFGADGTAPEWTAMNGLLECKAGAETRQMQFKTTPTPRLGARIGRFEVASGDQFGATSGERCEVRRGTPNGGFGTGDLEGDTVYTQFSTRFLAPWTLTGEGIFQQTHDSGSTYGAPFFRWRMGSSSNIEFRVVTGRYPNSTDAGNGVNAGTSNTHTGLAFATDVWFDFRHVIYYTVNDTGWYIAEMKLSTDTLWTPVARVAGVRTLPSYTGSAATSQFDKLGFYRGTPQASTNVVFHDGYQVAHSQDDAGYSTQNTDSRWNDKGWEGREQATIQVGNPDFEADVTGTAAAGGGTTTISRDTSRAKFGSASCKAITNGAASGQGIFHRKRSGSRYDGIVAGHTYTASMWMSGDGFEELRIGIEWNDAGGAVLSTTYCEPRALRTDFRRLYVTAVAPANAVTIRIRTSYSGTTAGTFWVDGVDFWEGSLTHSLFEGYIESWTQSWPDRFLDAECTISCTDAFKMLNLSAMPVSNPNVSSYPEVLDFDVPSFYYPLSDPAGTRAIARFINGDRTRPVILDVTLPGLGQRFVTVSEAEGVSGPAGTYKNTPTLGEPGLVTGDSATSVKFVLANAEYARVGPLDQSDLIDTNRLTLEAIIKPSAIGANLLGIIAGPVKSAVDNTGVFRLAVTTAGKLEMRIRGAATYRTHTSTATLSANTVYHVAGTWDGEFLRLYIDGSLDSTSASLTDNLQSGDVGGYLYIGGAYDTTLGFDGWMQHAAVYETQLSTARILAHSDARTKGFAQELSGTRVINALAASSLPSLLYSVGTGARSVQPVRQAGQGTLDVINPTVEAEGGSAMFFVAGSGVATFRDRSARAAYPYSTSQATFGDSDNEIPYLDIALSNDDSFLYNEIRLQRVNGELQTSTDGTSQTNYLRRTYDSSGLLNISDSDVSSEAADLLARYKDPLERVTAITFDVGGDDAPDNVQQALCREIGDQVTIKRRPAGGTAITQASYIERISHSINFAAKTWETTFAISPR